ncbi:MAG: AAA family ATPase [Betaproteobacteria bacterium]|nr:AAA family ATPase [Betaproteobacteria bacterium]
MKISIVSRDHAHAATLRQWLLDDSPQRQIAILDGGLELLERDWGNEPGIFVVDGICPVGDEFDMLEQLGDRHPGQALVFLCAEPSSELLLKMMRLGVREVLPLPVKAEVLCATTGRIEQSFSATPARSGKIIAFIACKGGSGATFLATNLAYVLAEHQPDQVALFDLNLQFGDASLYVSDHVPANTLADVADNISRMDASFLHASLLHVLPNFGVLAAPDNVERSAQIKPAHIETLLALARRQYDYVVLDMSRTLDAVNLMALDHTDKVFLVLQENLPFIRDTRRMLDSLRELDYGKQKIHLLVNRYEKGGEIDIEDVERTLGMKVFATIPNSYKNVSSSVNLGIPLLKVAPHDPVTRSLREIAETLGSKQRPSKGDGWLASLLHH